MNHANSSKEKLKPTAKNMLTSLTGSHVPIGHDAPGCKRPAGGRRYREKRGEKEVHGGKLPTIIIPRLQRRTQGPVLLFALHSCSLAQ